MKKLNIVGGIGILFVFMLVALAGCSDDFSPRLQTDYKALRLEKMDLSDAVSLGLQSGNNSSRAIDGEYKTAGLYKIDKDGNISAVAVYFQTDTLGNKLEHEEILRVAPKAMFNISDNYLIVADCDYYDCDGDLVEDKWDYDDNSGESYMIHQDVPYKNLIVRKSDGKIWCIDNVAELMIEKYSGKYYVKGRFQQDKKGNLFLGADYHVFKFNLDGHTGALEQITKNSTFNLDTFIVGNNDIVLTKDSWNIHISWPKSGFQDLKIKSSLQDILGENIMDLGFLYSYRDERGEMERTPSSTHLLSINGEPYIIIGIKNSWYIRDRDGDKIQWSDNDLSEKIQREYMWKEVACLAKIIIGKTPGSAYFDKAHITLTDQEPIGFNRGKTVFENKIESVGYFSNYILTSDGESQSLISILNLETSEWKWLRRVPFRVHFDDANMNDGRIWQINDDRAELGAFWFNPKELTDGFVAFNVQLPEYMGRINWNISKDNNKVVFGGVNPSTGDYEKIVVDVVSGNVIEQSVTEPEMIFEELIPLN